MLGFATHWNGRFVRFLSYLGAPLFLTSAIFREADVMLLLKKETELLVQLSPEASTATLTKLC